MPGLILMELMDNDVSGWLGMCNPLSLSTLGRSHQRLKVGGTWWHIIPIWQRLRPRSGEGNELQQLQLADELPIVPMLGRLGIPINWMYPLVGVYKVDIRKWKDPPLFLWENL